MRARHLILIAAALMLAIASCGAGIAARAARAAAADAAPAATTAIAAAVTPLPAPADTHETDEQIKHWQQVAQQAREDGAVADQQRDAAASREKAANAQIDVLKKERTALVLEAWQSRLAWTAGLMLVGILAGVALECILPTQMRGVATDGILACSAVAAAAWTLREVLPYLAGAAEVVAWSMVSGGAGYGLWCLWKFKKAAVQAADHGDRMEETLLGLRDWVDEKTGGFIEDLVDGVKVDSAKMQTKAGVAHIVAHLRGKSPDIAKHFAALPDMKPPVAAPRTVSAGEAPTEILPALPAADAAAKPPAKG